MRKSLLVTYFFSPQIGGIQNYLFRLCKGLNKEKIVILADKNSEGEEKFDREQEFKIYREKFFSLKLIKPKWLFLFFKIVKIIKKEKIEFLQFGHYHEFCLLGILSKILFRLPYLIYFHGIDLYIVRKSKLKFLLFKLAVKNAKTVIANSNFIANNLIKFGVAKEKIKIITPAVDWQKFNLNDNDQSLMDKYYLNGKRVIMSIGRLTKVKGIDLVIKSLPKVIKEIPNLVYLIVGEGFGDYRKELEGLVYELNLSENVFFAGGVKDQEEEKSKYYNLAELVVMPSREIKLEKYSQVESFGIVALEAQAMGRPIIAANIGGLKESVADYKTGILFPHEDIEALGSAIIKLLKDHELTKTMGRNGRERIEKEFNWSTRIKILENILGHSDTNIRMM